MTNMFIIQTLLSTVFILIGYTVFYIAFLISGHDIYRESGSNGSHYSTLLICALLFLIYPIGFITLTPELYISADQLKTTGDKILAIHEIIHHYAFLPFILAAFGLGVAFGCGKILDFRDGLLDWIRRHTLLSFHIITYDLSWDSFLSTLKRDAKVTVGLAKNNETVTVRGQLNNFSIRSEPASILLANSELKELDNNLNKKNGYVLLTEKSGVRFIYAAPHSRKKHHHTLSHSSQAFYYALSAFGMFCICVSIYQTYDSIMYHLDQIKPYHYLAEFYIWLFFIALVIFLINLGSGIYVIQEDYYVNKISPYVLSPWVSGFLFLEIPFFFSY